MTVLQVAAPIADELLARYVNQGQVLVERASLVGDSSDYEAWKAERKQWIEQTAQALGHIYGSPEEADEFKDAASSADNGKRWQQQYSGDLACVQAALDLLVAHHRQIRPAVESTDESVSTEPDDDVGSLDEAQPTTELQSLAEDSSEQAEPSGEGEPATSELEALPAEPPPSEQEPLLMDEAKPLTQPDIAVKSDRGSELAPAIGAELAPANGNGVASQTADRAVSIPSGARQVFVAHGRDERWMQAVAQLLEHAGSHTVTVLNERQDERRTLAEQFEQQPAGAHYAVVLLTADDVGAPRLNSDREPYYSPRARQGVVFEMGFLVAALTPGCVCVLYEDGVELPCQLDGIVYVRLDFAGTWQSKLLLALRSAGFDYDLNKLAPV